MSKNKDIHIAYIGRLSKEKGIEIVISCIKRSLLEKRNIVWHICGDGAYFDDIEKIKGTSVKVYGHISKTRLNEILENMDLVLMPSLFLETFGLVALETLSRGVPVCGFSRGGLRDFIHPDLALDDVDPIDSFFKILDTSDLPVLDVSRFSYERWIDTLKDLTEGSQKVLLINDYLTRIGGAEEYVMMLQEALISIGKEVELFGYPGNTNKWIRIFLMISTPFAFWRGIKLRQKIQDFHPDIIWMHSILRYIGPHGLRVVADSRSKKYITYHDLGLITPKPSQVYGDTDIPMGPDLGYWIPKKINIFSIFVVLQKWLLITWIWSILNQRDTVYILPSSWMIPFFQRYLTSVPIVFPHTNKDISTVNP